MRSHRLLVAFTACAVLVAGCGDDDTNSSRTAQAPDTRCPQGTAELTVRDVLPEPPDGMVLLRVRKDLRAQAREAFATGFGDTLRSLGLAVVAPRGREVGTGVGVLNLTVRADTAPPQTTATRQTLEIAGRDGVMQTTPGGGPTRASGSVGDCAVVVLNGTDEAAVRRVAAAIRQPG